MAKQLVDWVRDYCDAMTPDPFVDDVRKLCAENERLQQQNDVAYSERDALVAALSKVFPSHLCRHPDEDTGWENEWGWIICVHLPTGQATWHIHDSELPWFKHLEVRPNHWDGHSNEDKHQRLLSLPRGDGG